MDAGQIGEYQVEFAGRLDQTGNRRATEVGERGSVSVALAGGAKQPTPAVRRLTESALGEGGVTATGGDQTLEPGQAGDERIGHVTGPDRFECGRSQFLLGFVVPAEPDQRFGARQPGERTADRRVVDQRGREEAFGLRELPERQRDQAAIVLTRRLESRVVEPLGQRALGLARRARLAQASHTHQHMSPRGEQLHLKSSQATAPQGRHPAVDKLQRARQVTGAGGGTGGVAPTSVAEVWPACPLCGLAGCDLRSLARPEPSAADQRESARVLHPAGQ